MQVVTPSSNPSAYFNLHATGIGYLEDVRVVPVRKGSFLACRFSALRFEDMSREDRLNEKPAMTRFDLKVVGAHAKACVELLKPYVDQGKAVMVQLKIGDIYPEMFSFKSGPRQGEMGVNIKGRVLKVYDAQVDGKAVDLPPLPLPADVAMPEHQTPVPVSLLVKGAGYLNALRKVSLGEGDICWKASIAALRGDAGENGRYETTRFDFLIAPDLIDTALILQDAVLAKKKVLVGFTGQQFRPELFTHQRGDKQGQTDAVIKGVLSGLDWAKVDGAAVTLTRLQEAA